MNTKVLVMQSDGKKTKLFIYGAKSPAEFYEGAVEALKSEDCKLYCIDV